MDRLRTDLINVRNIVAVHGLGSGVADRTLADLQLENVVLRNIITQHCPHVDVKSYLPSFEGACRAALAGWDRA